MKSKTDSAVQNIRNFTLSQQEMVATTTKIANLIRICTNRKDEEKLLIDADPFVHAYTTSLISHYLSLSEPDENIYTKMGKFILFFAATFQMKLEEIYPNNQYRIAQMEREFYAYWISGIFYDLLLKYQLKSNSTIKNPAIQPALLKELYRDIVTELINDLDEDITLQVRLQNAGIILTSARGIMDYWSKDTNRNRCKLNLKCVYDALNRTGNDFDRNLFIRTAIEVFVTACYDYDDWLLKKKGESSFIFRRALTKQEMTTSSKNCCYDSDIPKDSLPPIRRWFYEYLKTKGFQKINNHLSFNKSDDVNICGSTQNIIEKDDNSITIPRNVSSSASVEPDELSNELCNELSNELSNEQLSNELSNEQLSNEQLSNELSRAASKLQQLKELQSMKCSHPKIPLHVNGLDERLLSIPHRKEDMDKLHDEIDTLWAGLVAPLEKSTVVKETVYNQPVEKQTSEKAFNQQPGVEPTVVKVEAVVTKIKTSTQKLPNQPVLSRTYLTSVAERIYDAGLVDDIAALVHHIIMEHQI